jgi:hypothetical protein
LEQQNKTAPVILYEVYSKRAILEPIDTLVILDRDTWKIRAIKSARKWGGVVVKIEAEILTRHPLTRRVLKSEIVFIHRPKQRNQERDQITLKTLKGKLRQNDKSLYRGYRR